MSPADLGGYPQDQIRPGDALDRLLGRHGNLSGDLSAGSGGGALGRGLDWAGRS